MSQRKQWWLNWTNKHSAWKSNRIINWLRYSIFKGLKKVNWTNGYRIDLRRFLTSPSGICSLIYIEFKMFIEAYVFLDSQTLYILIISCIIHNIDLKNLQQIKWTNENTCCWFFFFYFCPNSFRFKHHYMTITK